MEDHTGIWHWWQEGLEGFRTCFTEPGFRRFAEWLTGLVVDVEEHTITQALTGLGLERDWTALERFVEYGRWERERVERATWRTIAEAHPTLWHDYRVAAVDDTKVHRTSEEVWGVCTFHEPAARCPNRAETVRAHNWVVIGALIPGTPWECLPVAGRLYFRASQLPAGEEFVKHSGHAVGLLEDAAQVLQTDVLGVVDGAYGVSTVVRPLADRPPEQRRADVATRLRGNARLYEIPAARQSGEKGRPRKWGRRLPAPKNVAGWAQVPQQTGTVWVYGRKRKVEWQERRCLWYSAGPKHPVLVVARVEGYRKPWYLSTTSPRLTGLEVVEVFGARFRQEDMFRDLKQRLGAEECRAWTKEPILRTFQAEMLALTALRLMSARLDHERGPLTWWSLPPWNRHKRTPTVLDVLRLLRKASGGFGQFAHQVATFTKVARQEQPKAQPHHSRSHKRKEAA